MEPLTVRKIAKELATRTIEEQKQGFKEWAIMGDWGRPYTTMDRDYEINQLRIFKKMVENGEVRLATVSQMWNAFVIPFN
jgi:isoleucyl-tRNA synthetase